MSFAAVMIFASDTAIAAGRPPTVAAMTVASFSISTAASRLWWFTSASAFVGQPEKPIPTQAMSKMEMEYFTQLLLSKSIARAAAARLAAAFGECICRLLTVPREPCGVFDHAHDLARHRGLVDDRVFRVLALKRALHVGPAPAGVDDRAHAQTLLFDGVDDRRAASGGPGLKPQVDDGGVKGAAPKKNQRLVAVADGCGLVARRTQHHAQGFTDGFFVVHDQDSINLLRVHFRTSKAITMLTAPAMTALSTIFQTSQRLAPLASRRRSSFSRAWPCVFWVETRLPICSVNL